MPAQIIKVYKGTNIIKARLSGNRIKYGYRWTHNGKKFTRAQWDTKEDAQTAFSKFRLKTINPNRLEFDDVEIDLMMLWQAWKKRATARRTSTKRIGEIEKHIERFAKVASTDKLRRLTETDLLLYQNARLSEPKPRHNHTINKEVAMIRTVLRAAASLFPGFNWQPPTVEPLPQLHKGREVLLSKDQLRKILRELKAPCSPTDKPERRRRDLTYDAVVIGSETAMRISEILGLKKSQVHFERGIGFQYGHIAIISAKTHKHEQVHITKNVAEILKRRCEVATGQYLFKRDDQSIITVANTVRRALRKACKKAGIRYGIVDGAVFHTLRHSTTTELAINQKIPAETVMKITRHSSRTMMTRYIHPAAQAVEDAITLAELDLSDLDDSDKKQSA